MILTLTMESRSFDIAVESVVLLCGFAFGNNISIKPAFYQPVSNRHSTFGQLFYSYLHLLAISSLFPSIAPLHPGSYHPLQLAPPSTASPSKWAKARERQSLPKAPKHAIKQMRSAAPLLMLPSRVSTLAKIQTQRTGSRLQHRHPPHLRRAHAHNQTHRSPPARAANHRHNRLRPLAALDQEDDPRGC